MKINFSHTVPYTPTWRGNDELPDAEQIKCELKVLSMGSLMNLLDAFGSAGLKGEVDTEKVDASTIKPILEQFGDLLPAHVTIEGLYGPAGQAIDIKEIVEYPFFLNLCLELLMKLSEVSSPSDEDVKN